MSVHGTLNEQTLQLASFAEVEQLVQRLYLPGSPQEISQIQDSLQIVQRSHHGWQFADALLGSHDVKVRFFGALTFTIKINRDWDTLEESNVDPLLSRLLQWIVRLVNQGESSLVIKKLCTSLVAYFFRPSVSWNKCLLHILLCFKEGDAVNQGRLEELSALGAIGIMPQLQRPQLLATLWFATNLIEEVGKTDAASLQAHKHHERVISNLNDLVPFLQHALGVNLHADRSITEEAVKCFQSWVIYSHRIWIDGSLDLESLRSLIPWALQNLFADGLFQVTAECMTDILTTYPTFIAANDLIALSTAFSAQQGQMFLASLTAGEFEPEPLAFARLLLAYGDISIQDIAKTIEQPTSRRIMQQLLQLLSCPGYAGAEDEICTPALEFWQSYTEYLIDSQFGGDSHQDTWMDSARQYVAQAINLCWAKLRIPPQEVLAQWDFDAKGDFKAFRADVEDFLQSSYTLLGASIFDQLADLALESLGNHAWLDLEATLFCLNALAESISDEDSIDHSLSKVFGSSLFSMMMDPSISIPSKTQQIAVTLITSYTAFFERHAPFLPPMLTFLFGSLKIPTLSGVAAKAIYSTCDSCRAKLVLEIEAFLQQYRNVLTWEDVESVTKERVIGGIAAIVQAVSIPEQQRNGLSRLLDFVAQDVEACTALLTAGAFEHSQAKGLCALRCLINIGKSFQEPDDAIIDLEEDDTGPSAWDGGTWGTSQQRIVRYVRIVMGLFSRDGDIIEASCQILRTGYKETAAGPFVFPPKITEELVASSNIETARLEYILDTAGAMLSRHTSQTATRVDGAATTFLIHILTLIASMNYDPSTDPEVSSSCIDLAEKYIPFYLNVFLDQQCVEQIPTFFNFTVRCMECQEIMPRRASASFWASFFQAPSVIDPAAVYRDLVEAVLKEYGPKLSQLMIRGIGGEAARSELDILADPLKKMIFSQSRAKAWLSEALFSNDFPSSKVGNDEKRVWLQRIMSLRGDKKTSLLVKEFWIACRGATF